MKTSIPATLDLESAIVSFRESIARAMAIGALRDWDGEELRKREREIRQASLVLAGQCIALLIYSLATHQKAHREASERTKEMRHSGSEGIGCQELWVITVGNVKLKLRLPYIQGPSKKRKKGRGLGQRGKALAGSYYPFLEWLGMAEKVSPLVWTTVAQQGMLSNSFAIARDGLMEWGIRLSEGRIQKLVYRLGEEGKAIRQGYIEQMRARELATGEWLLGQKVVVTVDGGRARVRRNKRGKRVKNRRRGYSSQWKEPKLLTIYAVDDEGKRVKNLEVPLTNDGTMASVEGFMEILQMHLVRLGIIHAEQVLLVADGAEWIWTRIPILLETLGVPNERVIELIDFYHASTYMYAFAEVAFDCKKEAKDWAKRACSQLKRGQINGLITRMETLAKQPKSNKKKELAQAKLTYFTKQKNRFDYQLVQSLNLPIGSGAIESLIRQVINLRIKSTGKFWLKHHAEVMLLGRCHWAAGAWEQFCSDILNAGLSPRDNHSVIQLRPAQSVVA